MRSNNFPRQELLAIKSRHTWILGLFWGNYIASHVICGGMIISLFAGNPMVFGAAGFLMAMLLLPCFLCFAGTLILLFVQGNAVRGPLAKYALGVLLMTGFAVLFSSIVINSDTGEKHMRSNAVFFASAAQITYLFMMNNVTKRGKKILSSYSSNGESLQQQPAVDVSRNGSASTASIPPMTNSGVAQAVMGAIGAVSFCPYCGASITVAASRFCPSCGKALPERGNTG